MKRERLYGIAFLLMGLLTACRETAWEKETDIVENDEVHVTLNLSTLEVETRAEEPMFTNNENPIYNLRLLQFDSEGILTGDQQTITFSGGQLAISDLDVTLQSQANTVCLIANIGDMEIDVDNLTSFRQLLVDLPVDTETVGHLADNSMYMYGVYQGTVTEGSSLRIMMGRLFLRINLVLVNGTGSSLSGMTLRLDNVPAKTHIPFVDEALATDSENFTSYEETVTDALASGDSKTFYYYMPENISPAETQATTVTITAGGKTGKVVLGRESPAVTDGRDLTLSRNNIYTFELTLN